MLAKKEKKITHGLRAAAAALPSAKCIFATTPATEEAPDRKTAIFLE
jgi:hypothetical protein